MNICDVATALALSLGVQAEAESCKACEAVPKTFRVTVDACDCLQREWLDTLAVEFRKNPNVSVVEEANGELRVTAKEIRVNLWSMWCNGNLARECKSCRKAASGTVVAKDFLAEIEGSDCTPCLKEIAGHLKKLKGFRGVSTLTKEGRGHVVISPFVLLSFDSEAELAAVERQIAKADIRKHANHPQEGFSSDKDRRGFAIERSRLEVLFLCAACKKQRLYERIHGK